MFYIQIKEANYDWLKTFCIKKHKETITRDSPYWERYALTSYDEYLTMTTIYILLYNRVEVGYAALPSYQTDILSSINVDPVYRGRGVTAFTINHLAIKRLSCVLENTVALNLYKKLGFSEVETNDPGIGSVKLAR
jgi:GNAT superfamily N-acetyltransferase